MAHARRRFVELQTANQSTVAVGALELIRQLYDIEREVRSASPGQRHEARQTRSTPIARSLHDWLIAQRSKVADGAATAKAIDYSLKRWAAFTRFLHEPALPIDNNHDERQNIAKALSLGATAVFIRWPGPYGMAARGAPGSRPSSPVQRCWCAR